MGELIKLVKIDYDSMENDPRAATIETTVGIFTTKAALKAWFQAQPPLQMYVAMDGVYPQYRFDYIGVIA